MEDSPEAVRRLEEGPSAKEVDEEELVRSILKLGRNLLGITLGILCGIAVFVATNFLVLKGGSNVGAHLQLLGQFFLGYTVSFRGSLIGLLYGFAVGYASGWLIASVYNWIVMLRQR